MFCSQRTAGTAAWDVPADNISAAAARNQDHATIAINSNGNGRVAYHDVTGATNNDNEAKLIMFKPAGSSITYLLPDGAPSPQPGWQDRPFIALDGAGKMHAAWEDGPTGSEGIKYVRCLYSTPGGCDDDLEWEFNNVTISEAGVVWARTPHLTITSARTWISYEQELAVGTKEVKVLDRCLSAPFTGAWTLSHPQSDINMGALTNEFTEELGTPHIASRSRGWAALYPVEVGTVTLRQNATTGLYEGILYTKTEPPCS